MSQSLIANSQVDNEVHDFTWNIKNFDFISYIRNRSVLNQHVFSFTVGSSIDKVSTWKLFLAYDAAEKSPALFLQLIEYAGTDEFPVILEVYVDNGINEQFKLKRATILFTPTSTEPIKCNFICFSRKGKSTSWTLTSLNNEDAKIFSLKTIFQKLSGSELKLRIKFQIFGKYSFTTFGKDSTSSTILEREQAKSLQRHRKVALSLLESGDRADVTFETKDDQRIAAHKFILSMQSNVFAAMFATEMKEKTEGVVKLDDMGGDGLKVFLKFVYTGELDEKWNEFYDEVVYAANKYQVQSLIDMCQEMLPTLVSWDNCFEILKLAELHDLAAAKKKVENFIKSDPDKMLQLLRESPSSKRPRFT